ncbi:TPA: hypothetical protein JA993_15965 [Legionella pneumophila]|uniref:hypothetical protein n=1 Tax=Legionella pneumophila TaxID=446 RepID=UPI0007787F23|nr:hypothetical protein [Legionella pneumophila]HAT8623608.1 hypothetical protein [Legionella pneumophila]
MAYFKLNLNDNNIKNIQTILNSIPQNITEFNLSWCLFSSDCDSILDKIISKIPPQIIKLSLRSNQLGIKNPKQLGEALQKIPSNVIILDLSSNLLSNNELFFLLKNIPPNIIHLDLSLNLLGDDTSLSSLKNIPPTIKKLNLCLNGWDDSSFAALSREELKGCFDYLDTIYLNYDELVDRSPATIESIKHTFYNIPNIILVDRLGHEMGGDSPLDRANIVRKLGLNTPVPTLLHQCAFFYNRTAARKEKEVISLNIPLELKELLSIPPNFK